MKLSVDEAEIKGMREASFRTFYKFGKPDYIVLPYKEALEFSEEIQYFILGSFPCPECKGDGISGGDTCVFGDYSTLPKCYKLD